MDAIKSLNTRITEARRQFRNQEISIDEFEILTKGYYEEYLVLVEKSNLRNKEQLMRLIMDRK
ncbi:hypothetical protein [Robiginitalea biformata]|uniref:Uncharacterized protein n=1 Tax=Robiginitalea biformata (strain ATCC BAA-864 / DSM 15991 / KCTC 12146 / HTCC2501) TaxID=313596 RepID=A4CKK9_ROBBH|nr:hypothetical protein [Robiginitalea biformata]EAR15408.1 hypothetical protein RB2501_13809 [Robiginitalea biformata HTCC2501]